VSIVICPRNFLLPPGTHDSTGWGGRQSAMEIPLPRRVIWSNLVAVPYEP